MYDILSSQGLNNALVSLTWHPFIQNIDGRAPSFISHLSSIKDGRQRETSFIWPIRSTAITNIAIISSA